MSIYRETVDYEVAAEMFRLLAHPARLQILDELRRGDACVCHFQQALNRPQAYVSQQLGVLREAEVVESERDGVNMIYRLVDDRVSRLLDDLLGVPDTYRKLPACPCPKCSDESQIDGVCEFVPEASGVEDPDPA
ncbi:MAG: ArsR/SmtB family transcription factor [Anaerolineae bacterium]